MSEPAPRGVPLVDVRRGPLIESVHAGAACASDVDGNLALSFGDVDVPVYLRSSAKPFIAAAVVAMGTAERLGFEPRELALMAASHGGEEFHVATALSILRKAGLDESALQCGAHPPSYEPAAAALARAGKTPTALHNNCSGKHAGILAACVHLGEDPAGYLSPEHPVQRGILEFCARAFDDDATRWPVGVDGCSIPNFATSLRRAARGFARLATLRGLAASDAAALQSVRAAMAAEPLYVAGTGRFDTALIASTAGRIVGKGGAEGFHCDAVLSVELGFALKITDGAARAVPPATLACLRALGALDATEAETLASFAEPPVKNVAGRIVGRISARAVTQTGPARRHEVVEPLA